MKEAKASNILENAEEKSLYKGFIQFGDMPVECHVLESKKRVFTQRGVISMLLGDGAKSGEIDRYISRLPNKNNDLTMVPISFIRPEGGRANGYTAEHVYDICNAYTEALIAGKLRKDQLHIARQAASIVMACGKVGIIALVDEATGYQLVRAKDDLERHCEIFLRDSMREWEAMFPRSFFEQGARLLKVEYIRDGKRINPRGLAPIQRKYIYDAVFGDGFSDILKKKNPSPRHRSNHHQLIKDEFTKPVRDRVQMVISQMIVSDTWGQFMYKLKRLNKQPFLQMDMFHEF